MIAQALVVAAPPTAYVAAEASNSGIDFTTIIGTLITPAIVVGLLLVNKLHTAGDYDRLAADRDAERTERLRLQNVITEDVLPKAHRATLVMEALLPIVEAEVRLKQAREQNHGGD